MKRIPIISVIGLLLPVLLAQAAVADVAADLSQAEGSYKAHEYAQAEQAYLKVIREADRNKPAESQAAFTAGKSLPLVYIATDRLPQAKDAVQQLLSEYAQYEFLPHAIHEIVEGAKPLYKLAQVRQLYQDLVTARPSDPQALWLKMGMAIASVHLAEDQAVDGTLQNITSQHGADDRAAEVLNHIAWAYRKLQRYNQALIIYQYVVNNWAQKDRVIFTQQSIAICQVRLGDRQAADATLEVMLQKFGKDKNASKLLAWTVYEYVQAGEIEGAYKLFDLVLQTYPEAPETIEALLALATAVVIGEDRARIEPTVQTLLTRFAPTQVKASALHTVANMLGWKCRDCGNQPLEEQNLPGICNRCLLAIANHTLTTWPKSDWAMWAERDLATVALHRGDTPSAEASISRLSTDYASRKDTPEALNFLAGYCLELKKHSAAEAVYQHVVKEYPTYDLILLAKTGLGVTQIHEGDDVGAEAIFQKVLMDYANHAMLPEAIHLMAAGYYDQAQFDAKDESKKNVSDRHYAAALAKWQTIIEQLPARSDYAPIAYHYAGRCLHELGQRERAIEYYQKVCDNWPVYSYAWYLQIAVGVITEELVEPGEALTPELAARARSAYERVIDKYPNCPGAQLAAHRLRRLTSTSKGEQQ
jgi:TolA-binding protein